MDQRQYNTWLDLLVWDPVSVQPSSVHEPEYPCRRSRSLSGSSTIHVYLTLLALSQCTEDVIRNTTNKMEDQWPIRCKSFLPHLSPMVTGQEPHSYVVKDGGHKRQNNSDSYQHVESSHSCPDIVLLLFLI